MNGKELLDKIELVLDVHVRPKLLEHYGNVEVLNFNKGILEVKLTGQCSNCPSSKYTVESVIEHELMKYIPEVRKIVLFNEVSSELLSLAKEILSHGNWN
jgi:Fe-S cluster biogenesis protein NfuA